MRSLLLLILPIWANFVIAQQPKLPEALRIGKHNLFGFLLLKAKNLTCGPLDHHLYDYLVHSLIKFSDFLA